MGKRYYCEYCNTTMVSSTQVIRTHLKGLQHQKNVKEHYQKFKDIDTILSEEAKKTPCHKFFKRECAFGGMCRFSHYTTHEINAMRKMSQERKKLPKQQPNNFTELYNKLMQSKTDEPITSEDSTIIKDESGHVFVLPWPYPEQLSKYESLPRSLQPYKVEDFVDCEIPEWG